MDTSEYRGSINSEHLKETTNNMENQESQPNYANATKTTLAPVFPKKEQAIILNAVENLTLTDYVVAIGELVPQPKNIIFAFYMSNKRVCIFLSSVDLVNNIVKNHSSLQIQNNDVGIRRLITPARRVILSNISPTIPHAYLEQILKDLKLKVVSPVSFLRAGITKDTFGHVFSSRRQVYIQTDDSIELPSSIVIKFEDTNYRIFLNFDEMKCFACKQEGHIARYCPNQSQNENQNQNLAAAPTTATQGKTLSTWPETVIKEIKNPTKQLLDNINESAPSRQIKRPATTIESTSTENLNKEIENILGEDILSSMEKEPFKIPKKKNKTKKLKRNPSEESLSLPSIDEVMKPVQKVFQEANPPFPVTFDQMTAFLSNAEGNPDPISLAREYVQHIPDLTDTLTKLYPHFTHRNMKNRITRLKKKMRQQLANELINIETSDTEASQSSY